MNLAPDELERLVTLLKQHKGTFSWEYTNMKGIPSNMCTHHIYIKKWIPTYVPATTKDEP